MHVHHFSTSEEVDQQAAQYLQQLLERYHEVPILLLFSGGSALNIVRFLQISASSSLTIGVLDERWSSDTKTNNFAQLQTLLTTSSAEYIDTRPQAHESLEDLATRFGVALWGWRQLNPEGKIIITQGIGPDGHTAGIIPPVNLTQFSHQWVVGYRLDPSQNPHTNRITTSFNFLKEVDHSLFYAVGAEKKTPLEHALRPNMSLRLCPAAIIQEMQDVAIFTDQEVVL